MLRAAIGFFVIAILAVFLGANGIAGVSMEVGKLLLYVFLVLAVLSAVAGLLRGRGTRLMSWAVIALTMASFSGYRVLAEETWSEKALNTKDDVVKDSKKTTRKGKKKIRKATGDESIIKDTTDELKNAGDEVETGAKKMKRKVD